MNRRKRIAGPLLLALFAGIALYYFGSGKTGDQTETGDETSGTGSHARPDQAANPITAFLASFRTPIEFYGKVVNQHGDPVEGASVTFSLLDNPDEDNEDPSTRITLLSDREGKFSVKGLKGSSLAVRVTKEGYRTLPNLGLEKRASSRLIEYGGTSDQGAKFKDPANPTLFILHEIGPTDPMMYMKKRWKLPVNGNPVRIALDSEDGTGPHWIEFRFTSGWNQLPMDNEINKKRFDWKLEARIPGGGFLHNDSEYNSEAPEDGYQESIEIEYLATMPQGTWKRSAHRSLFVKFADDSYGRIRFGIDGASDRRPLYMTSWLNLKPGSRNLASDQWDPTVVSE